MPPIHARPSTDQNNIKVYIRVRPSENEGDQTGVAVIDDRIVQISNEINSRYAFTGVFGPTSSQVEVFTTAVGPLLTKFLAGYNACIMAYGPTGSGKSFTMGMCSDNTAADNETVNHSEDGLCQRAISWIFETLKTETYKMEASYLEVEGEEVRDLLTAAGNPSRGPPQTLAVRENSSGQVIVAGLTKTPVSDSKSVEQLLEKCNRKRKTRSTIFNSSSSRSHALFCIHLDYKHNDGRPATTSQLTFADLAGSEKVNIPAGSTSKAQRDEGVAINQGLLQLGIVIGALSTAALSAHHPCHIPYRSSKLTHILKNSIGGSSSTVLISCVSPAHAKLSETSHTLSFSSRAKLVKNTPAVNILPKGREPAVPALATTSSCDLQKKKIADLEKQQLVYQQRIRALEAEASQMKKELARAQAGVNQQKVVASNSPCPTRKRKRQLPDVDDSDVEDQLDNDKGTNEGNSDDDGQAVQPHAIPAANIKQSAGNADVIGKRRRAGNKENNKPEPAQGHQEEPKPTKKNCCGCASSCAANSRCGCRKKNLKCNLECSCNKLKCSNL